MFSVDYLDYFISVAHVDEIRRQIILYSYVFKSQVDQGPDLQNILRFTIRLSQVYRNIGLR